jgi:hypothetical protein
MPKVNEGIGRCRRWMAAVLIGMVLSACVQIATPDKPIVINLNINIKQDIVVKLDGTAKELIDENGDIF